jgi:hypothetical protein
LNFGFWIFIFRITDFGLEDKLNLKINN